MNINSSMRMNVGNDQRKLINILIDCVKFDYDKDNKSYINSNSANMTSGDVKIYKSRISLRVLRSINKNGYYNNRRQSRLNVLREHYIKYIEYEWNTSNTKI